MHRQILTSGYNSALGRLFCGVCVRCITSKSGHANFPLLNTFTTHLYYTSFLRTFTTHPSYIPLLHIFTTHPSYIPLLHTFTTYLYYKPFLHTFTTHPSYIPLLHTKSHDSRLAPHTNSQFNHSDTSESKLSICVPVSVYQPASPRRYIQAFSFSISIGSSSISSRRSISRYIEASCSISMNRSNSRNIQAS
jgi:hypothetical protein